MSWFPETKRTWLESLCIKILKCGAVPKHLAFIMDGNRRFASKLNMKHIQGHIQGFDKLAETLSWCLDMGISEVTVYAFSTENFKRSQEEVDGLMLLAHEKLKNLMNEQEKLDKYGVCIRVYGDIHLLPENVQKVVAETVLKTTQNNKAYLNVCLAYTARDEICAAVRELGHGVTDGTLKPEDVTDDLLSKCLYTAKSPDPDLLVRTSGESRLSDFLLWQSSFSVLAFFKVLWPEFSIWHLFMAILFYQFQIDSVQKNKAKYFVQLERLQAENDHREALKEYIKTEGNNNLELQLPRHVLSRYKTDRQERCQQFLTNLERKKLNYLNCIAEGTNQNCNLISA